MSHRLFARFRILIGMLVLTAPLSCSGATDWQAAQIADALHAAPPSVTHTAKIYAWHPNNQLVLVRDGNGPYTCVASGSASLRFGKPLLPSPDPFCADPHARAFIEAFWTEPDPDPAEPVQPLPTTPGTVWMVAGVPIVKEPVAADKGAPAVLPTERTGGAAASSTMTPQLMIMPLPFDPAAAQLPGIYEPTHPLTRWMLARGTPIGLAPVQMPQAVQLALMAIPLSPAQ